VMDAIERAVVAPQIKIVEKRAAWRQIFKKITGIFFDRTGNYESITGIRPCKLVSSRFGRDLFSRPSRNRRRARCFIGAAA
jgi:hypothetical protein